MVHTNYRVPRYSESQEICDQRELQAKAKFWQEQALYLEREFGSLFRSIEENGFATLTCEGDTIRLIADTPTNTDGE